ncbi:hypothetical protein ACFXTN_039442 [Malus domestica]
MLLQINDAVSNVESESFSTHEAWQKSTLKSVSSSSPAENDDSEMLLYSYSHVVHGFSARLTPQLSRLEISPAHVAMYPKSFGKMFTIHSPKFLGLRQNLGSRPNASFGQDVILGIIDTGIWPGSESFGDKGMSEEPIGDKGMSEVPIGWKGECENGTAFTPSLCNKKLIRALSFSKGQLQTKDHDYDLPRDFFGTATRVVPHALVAMYKVRYGRQIQKRNAIIAIGSLSAVEKGTVFVCAAGNNNGPSDNSTYNGAPWITTVGAGTLDRTFSATFTLDNGFTIEGSYLHESI